MRRFKNILFVTSPVAHDSDSFKRAALLARKNGAALKVVKTIRHLPDYLTQAFERISIEEAEELLFQEEKESLEKWVNECKEFYIDIELEILVGEPFIEVIRHVIKHEHDLVMKTAEGPIGYLEKLLGSTDMHLIRKCPTPVWMIKPGPYKEYKQVLAAVTPSTSEKERESLNDTIMQLATSFSVREKSTLHVIHAWKIANEATIESRSTLALMSKQDVRNAVDRVFDHHQKKLDEFIKKHPLNGIKHDVHLVKGDAEEIIPHLARDKDVELIIMGTVGRTGIPGFFIGNTAEDILNQVNCSVLAVKPEGFETPVTLES